MKKYKEQEVTERQFEDIVRKMPDSIEDGLRYVDHQKRTQRGPLDVLFVDSGNALEITERIASLCLRLNGFFRSISPPAVLYRLST